MAFEQPAYATLAEKVALGVATEEERRWHAIAQEHEDDKHVEQAAKFEKIRQLGGAKGRKAAEAAQAAAVRVALRPLSAIQPRAVEWLWEQRIPMGEITLVAGKGGVGKSMLLCTLAAWITRGTMRGQFRGEPRNVIYIPNEDAEDKALVPRLLAAGADMDHMFSLDLIDGDNDPLKLMLPLHLDRLEQMVNQAAAVAVIIDPLSSNMMDRDRNSPEVRASYERLREMADRANVAIIGNAHTRKGQSSDLLEAIMGSSEIGNIARAALGVIRNPNSEDDQIVLSQCKNNYGPMNLKSYTYTMGEATVNGFTAPRIVWGESSTEIHVNDILSDFTVVSASDVVEAAQWLREFLETTGDCPRKEVIREAAKEGYKEHTIKRASKRIGVVAIQAGYPRTSTWTMPTVGTSQNNGVPTGAPSGEQ